MKYCLCSILVTILNGCSNGRNALDNKADLESVKNYLTSAWHLIDTSAQVSEIKVKNIEIITEKQRLTEMSSYWFEDLKDIGEYISDKRKTVESQKELISLSNSYNFTLEGGNDLVKKYEYELDSLTKREKWMRSFWDTIRYRIPLSDTLSPVGYTAYCNYVVKSGSSVKADSASIVLDKNFKAIDRDEFFRH